MKTKKVHYPRVIKVTNWKEAKTFLEDVKRADRLYACQHGHVECSTFEGGPCCDEIATVFEFND